VTGSLNKESDEERSRQNNHAAVWIVTAEEALTEHMKTKLQTVIIIRTQQLSHLEWTSVEKWFGKDIRSAALCVHFMHIV